MGIPYPAPGAVYNPSPTMANYSESNAIGNNTNAQPNMNAMQDFSAYHQYYNEEAHKVAYPFAEQAMLGAATDPLAKERFNTAYAKSYADQYVALAAQQGEEINYANIHAYALNYARRS